MNHQLLHLWKELLPSAFWNHTNCFFSHSILSLSWLHSNIVWCSFSSLASSHSPLHWSYQVCWDWMNKTKGKTWLSLEWFFVYSFSPTVNTRWKDMWFIYQYFLIQLLWLIRYGSDTPHTSVRHVAPDHVGAIRTSRRVRMARATYVLILLLLFFGIFIFIWPDQTRSNLMHHNHMHMGWSRGGYYCNTRLI